MLLALGLFTLSNIISMLTTNFTVLLVARILPAFLHPVYVSMAFYSSGGISQQGKGSKGCFKGFCRCVCRYGAGCSGDQLYS